MGVIAVYKERQFAVLACGWIACFDAMFDIDGDETDDINLATQAIAPAPDGTWIRISLDCFKSPLLH